MVLLVAAVVAGMLPAAAQAQTATTARVYGRVDRHLQGQLLRTRGYLNDDCLTHRLYPCLTSTGVFRAEYTAQARTIQALSGGVPAPSPSAVQLALEAVSRDQVQWEVSPKPDGTYAPEYPTSDLDKQVDDACGQTLWRIDIVRDPNPTPEIAAPVNPWIIEVKRFGPGVRDDVDDQLACYEARAKGVGVEVQPDDQLATMPAANGDGTTTVGWSQAYPDDRGYIWCVWANTTPLLGNGHVYFAPQAETPEDVKKKTLGCDPDTETRVRSRWQESKSTLEGLFFEEDDDTLKKILITVAIASFLVETTRRVATARPVEVLRERPMVSGGCPGSAVRPDEPFDVVAVENGAVLTGYHEGPWDVVIEPYDGGPCGSTATKVGTIRYGRVSDEADNPAEAVVRRADNFVVGVGTATIPRSMLSGFATSFSLCAQPGTSTHWTHFTVYDSTQAPTGSALPAP